MTMNLDIEAATELATRALASSGADQGPSASVARAVVAAQARGRDNVGFAHLPYYCEALRRGAIDGHAEPLIRRDKPGRLTADARSGFAHHAFDRALDTFAAMARENGVAMLSIRRTYTCGELGYFPERLARLGLAAIAATNAGPAAVAPAGAGQAVFSTNPLAYAFPRTDGPPLLVDQSSSSCTLVDVRAAREKGQTIPGDWALDREGRPTDNPDEALAGSFKPFGGNKGSNIALLVELLSAGLGRANWSIDAPSFAEGDACPDVGQWILAMDASGEPDSDTHRIDTYLDRIETLGAYIPGQSRQHRSARVEREGITLSVGLYEKILTYCDPG